MNISVHILLHDVFRIICQDWHIWIKFYQELYTLRHVIIQLFKKRGLFVMSPIITKTLPGSDICVRVFPPEQYKSILKAVLCFFAYYLII